MRFLFRQPSRRWDKKKRRYVDRNGVVSPRRMRQEVERYIAEQKKEIAWKAELMIAGGITVSAFFNWMRERVNLIHDHTALKAYGGYREMTPARWGRIEKKVLEQYKYLSGFELDVNSAPNLAEALWPVSRALSYADSAYGTYENSVKQRESDAGVVSGRRIAESDDRTCDGCANAATEDYIPLDQILDIGEAECLSNCRCYIEFDLSGISPLTIERGVYASENVKLKPVFLYRR
jgi:hypothetical protein